MVNLTLSDPRHGSKSCDPENHIFQDVHPRSSAILTCFIHVSLTHLTQGSARTTLRFRAGSSTSSASSWGTSVPSAYLGRTASSYPSNGELVSPQKGLMLVERSSIARSFYLLRHLRVFHHKPMHMIIQTKTLGDSFWAKSRLPCISTKGKTHSPFPRYSASSSSNSSSSPSSPHAAAHLARNHWSMI